MKYFVKEFENLYDISDKFGITYSSLKMSNPQILYDFKPLKGEYINIPVNMGDIVQIDKPYTYETLRKDIKSLADNYPFLKVDSIGQSVLGKDIFVINIGNGNKRISFNAAHHAHEWITSPLLMKFIEDFSKHFVDGTAINGFDPISIFNKVTIMIVPMVNPDGVNLQIKGLTEENIKFHNDLIKWNNGSNDFTNWTSNIRGIDLNHNYDAGWEEYKQKEKEYGIFGPGCKRFAGEKQVSEPETEAMVKFTIANDFRLVLAFHSQGEVIYWNYKNIAVEESIDIAQKFKAASGYEIEELIDGPAASGGYKDWFIEKFRKPGFTIEVGLGTNPLPLSQFNEIYSKNLGIMLLAALV